MFELVVGEIDAILREMVKTKTSPSWCSQPGLNDGNVERTAVTALGAQLAAAKGQYEAVKALDEALFGEEFVAE